MNQSLSFLFWNINKKNLHQQINNLVNLHHIDILILAECDIEPNNLLQILNHNNPSPFTYSPNPGCHKIKLFSRFEASSFSIMYDINRYTIRQVQIPNLPIFNLVALHLPSKMNMDEFYQVGQASELMDVLNDLELNRQNYRTIIIGDFNMNPFDRGMVLYSALNEVMTKNITREVSRIVQGIEYRYFFNPMWGLQGELSRGICGTHYYKNDYQWQMFDEVLLRPELLNNFDDDSLQIIVSDGQINFLKPNGKINTRVTSDHLPITFKLNF